MSLFYAIRHGQTDWNVQGLLQGRVDTELNATGREQAEQARALFAAADIDRIIVSPKRRCLTTMEILCEGLDLPFEIDERLVERSFGDFEGQYRDDIAPKGQNVPDLPSVEPWADVKKRAHHAVMDALECYPGQRLCFITHGGFLSALGEALTTQCRRIPNATLLRFERVGFEWRRETIETPVKTTTSVKVLKHE